MASAKSDPHGKYSWSDGTKYFGPWSDNKPNGIGELIFSPERPEAMYKGDFVNGDLTGKCRLFFEDGCSYEGQILGGVFEGSGTIKYSKTKNETSVYRYTGNQPILLIPDN